MTDDERHGSIVVALTRDPEVTMSRARMFDGEVFKSGGKVFAMIVDGKFVIKLPSARVDALAEAGDGERFDPRTWAGTHEGMGRHQRV